MNWRDHLVGLSLAREDIWHSAEDAYEALRMQGLFRKWDDRILKIFVVSLAFAVLVTFYHSSMMKIELRPPIVTDR